MYRRSAPLIIAMALTLVLITSLTFMLTNASGTNSNQQRLQENIVSEAPGGEEPKNEPQPPQTAETIIEEIEETQMEPTSPQQELDIEGASEEIKKELVVENEAEGKAESKASIIKEADKKPQTIREDKFLNKETKNTNILCLGVADKALEMISIYSINKDNKKSAGIFLPTRTSLKVNGELLTLKEIYQKHGVLTLKKIISQCLEVDIPYHMVADNQGLVELSELIGPLYVENESINIPNLFVRPVSDKDDEILQSLAEKITQPKMLLQVPKLIKIFITNVESDIGVTGLWDLYSVFKNLNHSELSKIVLWGEKMELATQEYWLINPYDWHNVVYEMTQ
ncbi:MAG: hypothetical protein JM58_08415 [Peptococcaceae bacterium BICA1-8]|nr:MAG: hypothetical protein JM58_08415 [Peptococcaceae bacterium BICA1-8]